MSRLIANLTDNTRLNANIGGGDSWESFWATLIRRGNTVGPISVTPQSYYTNSGATTRTVGAAGDFVSLITAYAASVAGDVIELIDDTLTLEAVLGINTGVDGGGKSVKIKGKSTKTTVTLFNAANPIIVTAIATASIEFENIIFDENNGNPALRNFSTANDGFIHFINCEIDGGDSILIFDCKELVFDGVVFRNQIDTEVISYSSTAGINASAKIICNDCTCDYAAIDSFINHSWTGPTKLDFVSITNSDIKINRKIIYHAEWEVNEIDFRGNTFTNDSVTGILKLGVEATGANIDHYAAYNGGTAYVIGDIVDYEANLWECTANTTGNAPSKVSSFWKVAEVITGTIENNLIKKVTYSASGHGLFLGFGSYNFSVKNNIVTNFWWNYVIKGVNNTIQYNAAGEGFRGFAFVANDQAIFSNNTSRSDDDFAFSASIQAVGGTDVDNTTIRDNILTNTINGDDIFFCLSLLNTFNQNIYYGDEPDANQHWLI